MEKSPAFILLLEKAKQSLLVQYTPLEHFDYPEYYEKKEEHEQAARAVAKQMDVIRICALTYLLTKEIKYKDKAIDGIVKWCCVNQGWKNSFTKANAFEFLLRTMAIPYSCYLLSFRSEQSCEWLRSLYAPTARMLSKRNNNWGAIGLLSQVLYHLSNGGAVTEEELYEACVDWLKQATSYIPFCGGKDSFPLENLRTNSGLWYTYMALGAISRAFYFLNKKYEMTYPEKLAAVFSKFADYIICPETWPYKPLPFFLGSLQKVFFPCEDEFVYPDGWGWDIILNMQEELQAPCSTFAWEAVIDYGYLWPEASIIYEYKKVDETYL